MVWRLLSSSSIPDSPSSALSAFPEPTNALHDLYPLSNQPPPMAPKSYLDSAIVVSIHNPWVGSMWRRRHQFRALLLGFFSFLTGLGISLGLFFWHQGVRLTYYRDELIRTCDSLGDAVSLKFNTHLDTHMVDFVGFLTSVQDLSNSTIPQFSGLSYGYDLGITAISLMPIISRSKLAALESRYQFKYVEDDGHWSNYDLLVPILFRHVFMNDTTPSKNPVQMLTNILSVPELAVGTLLSLTSSHSVIILPNVQHTSILEPATDVFRLLHVVEMPLIPEFPSWLIQLTISSADTVGLALSSNRNVPIALEFKDDQTKQQIFTRSFPVRELDDFQYSTSVSIFERNCTMICTGTQAMTSSFKTSWPYVQLLVLLVLFVIVAELARRISLHMLTAFALARKMKHQKRLVSSLRTYSRAVVQAVNDPLLALDSSGYLVGSNQMAVSKLGLKGRPFSALHITDLIGPSGQVASDASYSWYNPSASGHVAPGSYEIGCIGPPSASFFAEVTASNVSWNDSGGQISQVLLLHDITDRIKILTDLHAAQSRAKSSSKAKTQLLLFLSHELRNPIYVIDSNLDHVDVFEFMKLFLPSPKILRTTRLITDMVTQVVELLSDYRSKVEANAIPGYIPSGNLVDLVNNAQKIIQPQLSHAQINLVQRVSPFCHLSGPGVDTIETVLCKLGQVIHLGSYPGKSVDLEVVIEPTRQELRLHCRGNIWIPADNLLYDSPMNFDLSLPDHLDALAHGVLHLSVMTLFRSVTPLGGLALRSQFSMDYGGFDLSIPLLNTSVTNLGKSTSCSRVDIEDLFTPRCRSGSNTSRICATNDPSSRHSLSVLSNTTESAAPLPRGVFVNGTDECESVSDLSLPTNLPPLFCPGENIIEANAQQPNELLHANASPKNKDLTRRDYVSIPMDVAIVSQENGYIREDSSVMCEYDLQSRVQESNHLIPRKSVLTRSINHRLLTESPAPIVPCKEELREQDKVLITAQKESGVDGVPTQPSDSSAQATVDIYTQKDEDESRVRRILVVEDNKLVQRVTQKMVQGLGYIYEGAMDGRECVNRVQDASQSTIDLVLMDLIMPKMDGPEAMRALRAIGLGSDLLPIIAVTANAVPEERERCIDAGFDEFVSKPLRKPALVEFCDRFFARKEPPA